MLMGMNCGREQRGEGVWSLSRGFLAAGARRVVASNWLVDDEAAASLVSVFCGAVAKREHDGALDYAESLWGLSTLLWITLAVDCWFGGMRAERWLA